ncbi:MAG: DNA polymerase IV [Clostridia bacterium]|nr:DNA polymerase IV [Clostridia bacterium]
MDPTILHVDMNNFFATVSCLSHPELKRLPVAICGDIEKRHGIILAKNDLAKLRGVRTASTIGEARMLCPDLHLLPPDNDSYLQISHAAQKIYLDYTDRVESFGIDECWLDVSGSLKLFGDKRRIADEIRCRMKRELGITVSVGVSFNKYFAKMGSDYQKPDATTVITRENFRNLLWPLPIRDMLYAGPATQKTLHLCGIETIGQLACANPTQITTLLGKNGFSLWQYANGIDTSPVICNPFDIVTKSIGNGTTAPRDLISDEDVYITMRVLAENVGARLRTEHLCCRTVHIELRDKNLSNSGRQSTLTVPTNLSEDILQTAFILYKDLYGQNIRKIPIRSISIRALQLENADHAQQLTVEYDMQRHIQKESLERTIDGLRERFGNDSIRHAHLFTDPLLSSFHPKAEHTFSFNIFQKQHI